MGVFENPVSEKTMDFQRKTRLFAEIPSENPQLFGFRWAQFVESVCVRFGDAHIEVVVGDDSNAVTADVGGP